MAGFSSGPSDRGSPLAPLSAHLTGAFTESGVGKADGGEFGTREESRPQEAAGILALVREGLKGRSDW